MGYSVDVKGCDVDVKGYGVNVKGYDADVRGYVWWREQSHPVAGPSLQSGGAFIVCEGHTALHLAGLPPHARHQLLKHIHQALHLLRHPCRSIQGLCFVSVQ
eukprot:1190237-Prorocentrum_minimum.AAC.1